MSNSELRYQQDYPQRKKKTKNKTDFSQTTYIVPEKHEEERERKLKPLVAKNDHQRETLQAFSEKQMIIQTGSAHDREALFASRLPELPALAKLVAGDAPRSVVLLDAAGIDAHRLRFRDHRAARTVADGKRSERCGDVNGVAREKDAKLRTGEIFR